MEVNIATYRSRIGNFNTCGNNKLRPTSTKIEPSRSSTKSFSIFGRLILISILTTSITSKIETNLQNTLSKPNYQDFNTQYSNFRSLATASHPIDFFILGGQVSSPLFDRLHLSYYDMPCVFSAATLGGVQAGHLDRGLLVTAVPLQSSILSDSNFYARYTYGNRSNRGIRLSHWNAGSAHLENKN